MRLFGGFLVAALLANAAAGQAPSRSLWLLYDERAASWCGYADEAAFQDRSRVEQPLESARIRFTSGAVSQVTYQIQPESGDWLVIDTYDIDAKTATLKRAMIFAQTGIQVVQQSEIRKGVATRLRTISARDAHGAAASTVGLDFPDIPIKTKMNQFPFLKIAQRMGTSSTPVLCEAHNQH